MPFRDPERKKDYNRWWYETRGKSRYSARTWEEIDRKRAYDRAYRQEVSAKAKAWDAMHSELGLPE